MNSTAVDSSISFTVVDAATFLTALGTTLAKHDAARPQREAANASSWMLFMQRVLVDVAGAAGLHSHIGDVFDLAFSAKERSEWAPPLVTIAHDNEWTDAEVAARIYEMLVGFAPLRVAFVYPDIPPDECAKRILAFAEGWEAPHRSEDLVLVGDPRGVHFRWPEWRVLRRDRGGALRDVGPIGLGPAAPRDATRDPPSPPRPTASPTPHRGSAPTCLCAATREVWDAESGRSNWRVDAATAAEIMSGSDPVASSSVTPHPHYSEERIDDTRYVCRSCGSAWKNRVFSSAIDGSSPRAYFTPEAEDDAGAAPSPGAFSCGCARALMSREFKDYRTIAAGADAKTIIGGCVVVARREDATHLRCRTCNREWMHWLRQDHLAYVYGARLRRPVPLEQAPACGCAAAKAAWRPEVPEGKEERAILAGCDVVSSTDDAIAFRCRTCNAAWTSRRYDSGHVSFTYLEPG
jgi:hypothetical protein